MNYILFDGEERDSLLPLTYTKPVADLRVGILTIREKWEQYLNAKTSTDTEDYLATKYPLKTEGQNIFINGSVCPTQNLLDAIASLNVGEVLVKEHITIAAHTDVDTFHKDEYSGLKTVSFDGDFTYIAHTWDIFSHNGKEIAADYAMLTKGKTSQPISSTNTVIAPENVFIEEGAIVECSILNATDAYIYIGKDAEIMEGCIVRGSLAMCEHSVLKMGAKIYGPTTVGPYSKVGGEVGNSVITGYSNKGHDGYMGNSVLGEWCNLGADSNTSNLKNNYAEVKLWDYKTNRFQRTGLQFCGLVMGDHSKCGINTMFNTGTVVGVNANIFGSGFPRNFVPSYSWGGASGFVTYQTNKAFEVAEKVMERRSMVFDDTERDIMQHIFEITRQYRNE